MAEGIVAGRRPGFYRPELDVLRFGAFLLVFIHHGFPLTAAEYSGWGIPPTLATLFASGARAGALGVDLFFALSAYLITALLIALALTVAMAPLSCRFLESPFLRLKNRFEFVRTRSV